MYVHFTARRSVRYRISDSTVSGNLGQGISFKSTETKNHVFQIERSKITKNGLRATAGKTSLEGIHLNATNQVFTITNSYIAENKNGGIYVELQKQDIPIALSHTNHIHGNAIEHNRGKALFLKGTTGQPSDVKLTNNYFSFNLGFQAKASAQSVCKLSNLSVLLQANFLYNNSGQYIVEFDGSQSSLRFINNTLLRNRGLGDSYGVTFLCNGAAEMHGNVLQNPNNRYQITTTLQRIPLTVNATLNWWGESTLNLVSSLIMDKNTDYRLSLTVVFNPFLHLPPRKSLSGKHSYLALALVVTTVCHQLVERKYCLLVVLLRTFTILVTRKPVYSVLYESSLCVLLQFVLLLKTEELTNEVDMQCKKILSPRFHAKTTDNCIDIYIYRPNLFALLKK